ncbi:MAG: acetate/propionate family kinase [Spirochaetales bacterium]|nr:acetate/propionate family kinase [Spirochaetales bacterium]
MNILVLNCGSSSLKFKLYSMPGEKVILGGEAQRVGVKTNKVSEILIKGDGLDFSVERELKNHTQAFQEVLVLLKEQLNISPHNGIEIFGHRYVHPGPFFDKTTRITEASLKVLKKTLSLAPLHNPIIYDIVEYCYTHYADTEQYVVFDTSFHSTIPDSLSSYGIPYEITQKYGCRKYGFHGISHQYVMEEACQYRNRLPENQNIISLHLGTGGASICAIKKGKSLNSTMGYTPLEGLIMNTRSGDLDAGVLLSVMYQENLTPEQIETILNKKSGILALYQKSADLRDIIKSLDHEKEANEVFQLYISRIHKYLGYYLFLLQSVDMLIFTDTIGCEEPLARERICQPLSAFGIYVDPEKNVSSKQRIFGISNNQSRADILVVQTDEEKMIAKEVFRQLC